MAGQLLPCICVTCCLIVVAASAVPAHAADALPPIGALPELKELPDLFTFRDGTKVASPNDWTRRRAELLALIQHYEYGALPPAPAGTRVAELQSHVLRGVALHKQYKVTCALNDAAPQHRTISFILDLMLPIPPTIVPGGSAASPASGPLPGAIPVIVRGDWNWHKTSDEISKLVLQRGYALAEFNRLEFAPDNERRDCGLYLAYPDAEFGALAAWAWGYARCVDALLTLPEIDGKRIAITGHSRGGKATLLAGALDDRIALVNANGSGCGGTAPFRNPHPKAETMAIITKRFPFWFSPRLRDFVGLENRLPFDQHALSACVAPRAFLDTEASEDLWANPSGARQMHDAAHPVFQLLGAGDKQAIHLRPGKHEHNIEDWSALLDFADAVFKGKPTTRNFDARPTTQPAR